MNSSKRKHKHSYSIPPKPKYHYKLKLLGEVKKPVLIAIIAFLAIGLLGFIVLFGGQFVGKAYMFAFPGGPGNQIGMFYENGEVVIKANLVDDVNITGVYLQKLQ